MRRFDAAFRLLPEQIILAFFLFTFLTAIREKTVITGYSSSDKPYT